MREEGNDRDRQRFLQDLIRAQNRGKGGQKRAKKRAKKAKKSQKSQKKRGK